MIMASASKGKHQKADTIPLLGNTVIVHRNVHMGLASGNNSTI